MVVVKLHPGLAGILRVGANPETAHASAVQVQGTDWEEKQE